MFRADAGGDWARGVERGWCEDPGELRRKQKTERRDGNTIGADFRGKKGTSGGRVPSRGIRRYFFFASKFSAKQNSA